MRRGLVVGKFMPLHRGHQLLIESALATVDDLTIVVYDSNPPGNYTPMPIEKRLQWLAILYPQAENIIARKDPLDEIASVPPSQAEKDDPKYAQVYADDLQFLGQFDYVFSSEEYGAPFAAALGAKNVVVDAAREMLPISGTEIRENLYEHRGWMDPVVYRSLIQKVVFVGTESAGKTTLARRMAEELDTRWTHEYGRELWEAQGLTGTFRDMFKIAEKQYQREQAGALHSDQVLFCDTNAWTTLQWSLMYSGSADARLYDLVERTKDEYIWYFCDNDFGWVDDGTRELRDGRAEAFSIDQMRALTEMGIRYRVVNGSLEQRVGQVTADLERRGIVSTTTQHPLVDSFSIHPYPKTADIYNRPNPHPRSSDGILSTRQYRERHGSS